MQSYTKNMQKIASAYMTKPHVKANPLHNTIAFSIANDKNPQLSSKSQNRNPIFFVRRQSDKPISRNEFQMQMKSDKTHNSLLKAYFKKGYQNAQLSDLKGSKKPPTGTSYKLLKKLT